jgi:hypothetical protein
MSRLHRVTLVALLTVCVPAGAPADIITTLFSDDFEADTPNVLNATLINWNVTGSVDMLTGNECTTAGSPTNCVDLDGTAPPGGSIQTKSAFAIDAGTYQLAFDLAGSQRHSGGIPDLNTVTVSVGSYFLEDFTLNYDDPFQTFERDFLVGGPDSVSLIFAHQGADQVGLLLDNVRFSKVTPEYDPDPNTGPNPDPTEAP